MMLAVSAVAQAATVNVSLEPSTKTVLVGDTFDLKLWLRSDTPDVVMHDIELLLYWDHAYVSFDGSFSTTDGDYDWTEAMSYEPFPGYIITQPMYPHEGTAYETENKTYDDGDAWISLYPNFSQSQSPPMSKPQTDLNALTLTFTALAVTDSTVITVAPDLPTGIKAEWYKLEWNEWTEEWYWRTYVSECSGTMTGATVKICEPELTATCTGFEPPMDKGTVKVKKNRVLPFKAELLDLDGYPLTDVEITAPPVIQVIFDSGTTPAPDVTEDALSAGHGTEGNKFVFDGVKWFYNLKTKDFSSSGTYTVTMVSGDECEYVIEPTCTATFVIE
jgi:hypothetical protein